MIPVNRVAHLLHDEEAERAVQESQRPAPYEALAFTDEGTLREVTPEERQAFNCAFGVDGSPSAESVVGRARQADEDERVLMGAAAGLAVGVVVGCAVAVALMAVIS